MTTDIRTAPALGAPNPTTLGAEPAAVTVRDLVKHYRKNGPPALAGVSFSVSTGEVFGLLGPNGAGKTTTIGILTTMVRPTAGTAAIHGVDVCRAPSAARGMMAVVAQRNNLDRSLSIRQNLLYHARYHGVPRAERTRRAEELLARMGLADRAHDRLDAVSGGQAQRVMIARALMHAPRVLFLDEPSTGLDPQSRLFVHNRIAELRDLGVTVVLTTHDMDEAAKLCDRVGIVDRGRLLALDTPATLTRSLPGSNTLNLTVRGSAGADIVEVLSAMAPVRRVEAVGTDAERRHLRIYVDEEPDVLVPDVLGALAGLGVQLCELSVGTASLEDVFIHLTGRELR
jgi:ABC-2 type transport system ATP-binding protein